MLAQELAEWNRRYEERFTHIFIICASGKGAAEMLSEVKSRYAELAAFNPYVSSNILVRNGIFCAICEKSSWFCGYDNARAPVQ